jgi:adenosylcobinamide-GDP ribazoletransferase
VLALAFGLMLTGGFHEDGATDAMDGLGGGWTRERVLEIMKDSRIGAYGAMALFCLLALRGASLVALGPRALVAMPLAMAYGRWSIALVLRFLPPIAAGLAKEVHRGLDASVFVLSSALAALATLLAHRFGMVGVSRAALAAVISALAWIAYLKRRMGGQSGDLLGAGNQIVEAAALLGLLAQ